MNPALDCIRGDLLDARAAVLADLAVIDAALAAFAPANAPTADDLRMAAVKIVHGATPPADPVLAVVLANPGPPPTKPAPKAAKAKPAPKKTGRRPSYDYAEIGRLVDDARQRGEPGPAYVSEHLGITLSAARNAVQKARTLGLVTVAADPAIGPKSKPTAPRPTLTDALPAPQDRPARTWTPAPGENVLTCHDCGHLEPITGATALNRHCMTDHQRAASIEERMPHRYEAAS